MLIPPVIFFILSDMILEDWSLACFIAAVIKSSNISIESESTEEGFSGLIASGAILIDLNLP